MAQTTTQEPEARGGEKRIRFYLEGPLVRRIRLYGADNGLKIGAVIAEILDKHLPQYELREVSQGQ